MDHSSETIVVRSGGPDAHLARLATALSLSLTLAGGAYAQSAAILVVGEGKPYLAAARAAAAALGTGVEPTVLPLDAPLPGTWQAAPPEVVVAVGARAVRLALARPDTTVVAAMVLQESPELQNARVVSVPLAVPMEKQVELLQRLVPGARRIGLVVDPTHSAAVVAETRAALAKRGLELVLREVQDPGKAAAVLGALLPAVDALLLVADTTVVRRDALELLVQRSQELKIPVIGYSAAVVQSGLLAGIAVEPEENGQVAAAIARALAGGKQAKPAVLVGQLHLNLKIARLLSVSVPADLTAPPTKTYDSR